MRHLLKDFTIKSPLIRTKQLKDELASPDEPAHLHSLVSLAIHLDNCLWERPKVRSAKCSGKLCSHLKNSSVNWIL